MRVGLGVVRGRSMEPTLYDGDRLLLLHGGRLRVGRLAVVRLPDGVIAVKRAVHREAGGWWVERDNPEVGVDSWSVGPVADEAVVARVLTRVWPPRRGGSRGDRAGRPPGLRRRLRRSRPSRRAEPPGMPAG